MRKVILLSMILLFSCVKKPVVEPIPQNDASCEDACGKLMKLGCEEGKPLEDGTTCVQFCNDSMDLGHDLQVDCIVYRVDECSDLLDMSSICPNP